MGDSGFPDYMLDPDAVVGVQCCYTYTVDKIH